MILTKAEAKTGSFGDSMALNLITLKVHSSLEAVGFLSVVTGKLAERGISVNAVSAYFHDHLLVPPRNAAEALNVLREIAKKAIQD